MSNKYLIGINYESKGDGYKTLKKLIEKEKGRTINGRCKNNLLTKIKKFEFVGKINGARLSGFLTKIAEKEINIEKACISLEKGKTKK